MKQGLGTSERVTFDDVESRLMLAASSGVSPGLERIGRLLRLLGNPQNAYPVLHVVGTNGKGSTCAFLASVLRAAGYRTALYSSPHLETLGERLLIDGRPLDADRWGEAVTRVLETVRGDAPLEGAPPSYFELISATAFLLASEERVDVAVVEAGLGGRLDATNLSENVVCSVVTSISMDHTEYLGDTLEKVAGEKFAVVRPDVPACFLGDNPGLIPLFKSFCNRRGAPPFVVSEVAELENVRIDETGCSFDFRSPGLALKGVRTRMIGRYQVSNAALALLAIDRVRDRFVRLSPENVRKGMEIAFWPGRLELLGLHPPVLLDGGHNRDGVDKLVKSVRELWPNRRIGVVYSTMRDKDYGSCLELLAELSAVLYATSVPGVSRSLPPDELERAASRFAWRAPPRRFELPVEALDAAMGENDLVLVCGSLYLIGWIRPVLTRRLEGE